MTFNFVSHDGYLFKGPNSCIPQTLVRNFLDLELHVEGLRSHFGKDKNALPSYWSFLVANQMIYC